MRTLLLSFFLLFFSSMAVLTFGAEDPLVLVVSLENNIGEISPEELKSIYLKDKKNWQDGTPILPIDLGQPEAQERFSRIILKKNLREVKIYWMQQIFTGRAAPPLIVKDDREVKEWIASNRGAIGYIHSKSLDDTIKPILIGDKRTLQ